MNFDVIAVRSHTVSPDGSKLTISFTMKGGSEVSVSLPADHVDGVIDSLMRAKQAALAKRKPKYQGVSFHIPKRWTIGIHPIEDNVLLVFDDNTEMRAGFALAPQAAIEMGHALAEKARLIADRQPPTV